ncbi:MAG: hypothetical protein JWQ04_101 [Pedosphaera sp.]|nr:hypothetical protein [Pedosphaera sp.]
MINWFAILFLFAALSVAAQTNSAITSNTASRAEQARAACVEGRRYVCGRVMQITPEGLVVESGFTSLMKPPLRPSWVIPANVSATRDPNAVEAREPDSPCIGLVFVTDIPKKPAVNLYDYVVLHAYPAGQYVYTPVAPVQKIIRKFSAGLDTAVKLSLQPGGK